MEMLLFSLALMAIAIGAIFLAQYSNFRDSGYKAISDNSFLRTISDKGFYGEYLTYSYLKKLDGYKKLMTNLYIPKEDGTTTEIDLLMLSEKGIYVIESKNYSGWIFGDEKSKFWTQTLPYNQKSRFFNPIWQNKGHIKAFKSLSGIENDDFYKSYIVFSERCTLKNVSFCSQSIKVINRDKLLTAIKADMESSSYVLSREDVDQLYMQLQEYALADEATKKAHIEDIRSKKY
ncbi:MAG: nuclease-related domain-containing protein [Clostridiaceae bacterium]